MPRSSIHNSSSATANSRLQVIVELLAKATLRHLHTTSHLATDINIACSHSTPLSDSSAHQPAEESSKNLEISSDLDWMFCDFHGSMDTNPNPGTGKSGMGHEPLAGS